MNLENMKLQVNGRHIGGDARFDPKNIVSSINIHEDNVTLRLGDKENLEWWLEIDLPKTVLKELLELAESHNYQN